MTEWANFVPDMDNFRRARPPSRLPRLAFVVACLCSAVCWLGVAALVAFWLLRPV